MSNPEAAQGGIWTLSERESETKLRAAKLLTGYLMG